MDSGKILSVYLVVKSGLVVGRLFRLFVAAFFIVFCSPLWAASMDIRQTPYSSLPSVAPGMVPLNPMGRPPNSVVVPRGSDSITISSGMFQNFLPKIPNLEFGYMYTFGTKIRAGTASVDYVLPLRLDGNSTVFGEAHGEFQSLAIDEPWSMNSSTALSFGGGVRRMIGRQGIIGLYSFFDTAKLSGHWYSSGSVGAELAALIGNQDAIDINFNWYGQALTHSFFSNSFGYTLATDPALFGTSNFDYSVGISHELYEGGPDFRLSVTGYKIDTGSDVQGYQAGAELKSRDGVFVLKYDVGHDHTNKTYQSIAAFLNMGFQLENLAYGKSPIVMPEPLFRSPRNIARLADEKAKRNWHHIAQQAITALFSARTSGAIDAATSGASGGSSQTCSSRVCPPQTVSVVNHMGKDLTLYMVFNVGATGGYNLATDFPGWTIYPGNPYMLTTTLKAGAAPLAINFPCTKDHVAFNITADGLPQTGCAITQMEFNLCANWMGGPKDTYDISLVNGFNYPAAIIPSSGQNIVVTAGMGNANNLGVYSWGCDTCSGTVLSPCGCLDPHNPAISCEISQNNGPNYTVVFGAP